MKPNEEEIIHYQKYNAIVIYVLGKLFHIMK